MAGGRTRRRGASLDSVPARSEAVRQSLVEQGLGLVGGLYIALQTYTTKGTVQKRWLRELASNLSFNQSGLRVRRSLYAKGQYYLLQLQLTDRVMNELSMYANERGLSAEVSNRV